MVSLLKKHRLVKIVALFIGLVSPSIAAEGGPALMADDLFTMGDTVSMSSLGVDDMFVLAQTLNINQAVSGSVHALAKDVNISANVGHSVYAVGDRIAINAAVADDVQLAGQSFTITGKIGGDLRALGNHLSVDSTIAGDLQFAGHQISLNGPIKGSAILSTDRLEFGPAANIGGNLILYGEQSSRFNIPASVISSDHIIYRSVDQLIQPQLSEPVEYSVGRLSLSREVLYPLLIAIIITSIFVIMATDFSHRAYDRAWQSVWSCLGYGFIGLALISGGIIVTAVTFIGIPVSILLIGATILVTLLGYWMGSYFIAARIWLAAYGSLPSSLVNIILTATLGVLCAEFISSIPFLGWWLTLVITLFGVGALSPWRISPAPR